MKFRYRGKHRGGEPAQGELEAESIAEARSKLRNQGLFVVELAATRSSGSRVAVSLQLRRVASKADILILLSQLSIMVQSGVDLAEALRNLTEQCSKPGFKAVLQTVYNDVSGGVSFSVALKRHPGVFDETFVAVIAAGECSGTMTAVLERLTTLLRDEMRLRSAVWSLLMYPLVLCSVTVVVMGALLFFVLPQFATVFVEMGRSPPPLTAVLLAIGAFAEAHVTELALGGLAIIGGWYFLRATPPVRRAYDYLVIHGAIIRHAARSLITGRLFRLLGTMLQTGVPMLDCIRLSRDAVKNIFFRRMFEVVEHDVLHGQGMAKSLLLVSFLPAGAAHMVATAEKSGRLGQVLQMIGEYYEDDGERRLRNVIKVIEPAIILILGAVVACVVLSVVLPLLDMSTLSH